MQMRVAIPINWRKPRRQKPGKLLLNLRADRRKQSGVPMISPTRPGRARLEISHGIRQRRRAFPRTGTESQMQPDAQPRIPQRNPFCLLHFNAMNHQTCLRQSARLILRLDGFVDRVARPKIVAGQDQSRHSPPTESSVTRMENFFRNQIVVVTGARGFIGSHVADQLVKCGARVRGITRSLQAPRGKNAAELEWYQGDVTDVETLRKPFADARYIFHVAGDYRFWARNPETIYRNNVSGTENVLQLASETSAERIVVTSTQGVLEPGTLEKPGNETRRISSVHGPYKSSKLAAHDLVRRHVENGAPIISVLPGAPIGENDLRPTPTGAVIVQFLRGKLPLLARTGLSFVDVRDCARGHLLAMVHGKIGDDYLLAGRNLWLGEFLQLLAPYSNHAVPTRYAPIWLSRIAAFANENWHRLIRSDAEPFITMESVRMSERPYFFSSEKAMRELHYTLSPLENAVERAVRDFTDRGIL